MTTTIRLATDADLVAINDIYNYYVARSTCTYQLEPEPLDGRRAWFAAHPPEKYPVTVAEIGG
jgi:phosphinothricin acetyltransferase